MTHRYSVSDLNKKLQALSLNDTDQTQIDTMATAAVEKNGEEHFASPIMDDTLNGVESLNLDSSSNDSRFSWYYSTFK